jgi:hypothetical protein
MVFGLPADEDSFPGHATPARSDQLTIFRAEIGADAVECSFDDCPIDSQQLFGRADRVYADTTKQGPLHISAFALTRHTGC